MTHIYLFNSEESLTKKIDTLKTQEVLSSDMIVSAINRPVSNFLNYKDIEFVKADGSIWEKLVGKVFDQNAIDLVARRFNLSERKLAEYKRGVNSGQMVLLVKGDEAPETKHDNLSLDEIYDEYGLNSEKD
ncbi:general stress protein [Phocicoccus pinnipedialis]|uniref:Heat induced stress protein YflT n=1 Tax=Phocicoccus pinnipedialis TaxID=110845 RepID=A0A6V7R5G9_9BACL|nr:general stress protein [Jeotgalicoccus pinnipedialis]MBP1939701.1 hypothetical protein [Jeotgalicoccus pinnipedialis]CAD2072323.1 Heat induced stress protein YflT [Jeotgalicoccus pinnipedialis]